MRPAQRIENDQSGIGRIGAGLLDPGQIDLVRRSYALVEPNIAQATALWCRRLAATSPDLRARLADEPRCHAAEVASVLRAAVSGLDDVDALRSLGTELAVRCADGVRHDDVEAIREAALWTLETGLGHRFTPAHRDAWRAAFDAVASAMLDAAVLSAR